MAKVTTETIKRILELSINVLSLIFAAGAVYYAALPENRFRQSEIELQKSNIQLSDFKLNIDDYLVSNPNKMGQFNFSVTNYTGYDAKNVIIDDKYDGNSWLHEWIINAVNVLDERKMKGVKHTQEQEQFWPGWEKEAKYTGFSLKKMESSNNMHVVGSIHVVPGKQNRIAIRIKWVDGKNNNYDKFFYYIAEPIETYGEIRSFIITPTSSSNS